MANRLATADQVRIEREALEVFRQPAMQAAMADRRAYWLDRMQPRETMRRSFEAAFEEVAFGAIVWSLNTDAERPAVVVISRLPHVLDGERVPGSRWGLDNPDSIYRVIPIDGAERYVIRGQVFHPRLTENYFTLWDAERRTVDVLDGKSLVTDADGRFEIFVDADEKGERPNHVRSSPAAVEFYIRDVLADWGREQPNALTIERLGGAPQRPPRTLAEKVERAVAFFGSIIDDTMRWNAQATDKPANIFDFTIDRDTDGALRNQIYVMGHFDLAEDEALVIDVGLGGAEYFLAPITNFWGTTNDIVHRSSSRNLTQADRNADGSVTLVVSLEDPGVANWLDPCGMERGILTLRWAEFAEGRPGEGFGAHSRVVRRDRLQEALRPETRRVSPEERRRELAARAESYVWRIAG